MTTAVKPTMGRIVRYSNGQGEEYSAMITGNPDNESNVSLCVFLTNGLLFIQSIPYGENNKSGLDGYWFWPERV